MRIKNFRRLPRWQKENNPLLVKHAYSVYQAALKSGELKRGKYCSECGVPNGFSMWGGKMHKAPYNRLHGHHRDYHQPLSVRWLCVRCHKKEHVIINLLWKIEDLRK